MENLQLIKNLVGDISIDDLKYVDYSISTGQSKVL